MAVNDFVTVAVQTISEQTGQANAVAEKIIHADNSAKLIHEVRETSDDENIVKFRQWFDNANAAIERKVNEINDYIVSHGLVDTTPVDIDAETETYKSLAAQIKGMVGALKNIPGGTEAIAQLPELKGLPGVRKSSGTTGGGTGTRRPRLSAISVDLGDGNKVDVFESQEDKKTGEKRNVANMTVLSKFLSSKLGEDVSVQDLQHALFTAAKTEDLSTLDGNPVEFAYTVGDKNVLVTATPNKK